MKYLISDRWLAGFQIGSGLVPLLETLSLVLEIREYEAVLARVAQGGAIVVRRDLLMLADDRFPVWIEMLRLVQLALVLADAAVDPLARPQITFGLVLFLEAFLLVLNEREHEAVLARVAQGGAIMV